MSCRVTIFSLCLVLLAGIVFPQPCHAQIRAFPTNNTKANENGSGHRIFVVDRGAVKLFKHAKKRLENKDYQNGLDALQRILELKEDSNFFPKAISSPSTKPDKKKTSNVSPDESKDKRLCRSLKGEALRLIAELPEEGRQQYQNRYAGEAKRLLQEARQSGDVKQMESLARRYFHTPSGYEATWWLGNRHFDRSEPLAAALFYERLRKVPRGAKRFEPMLTLKTAICWGRAGLPELAVKKLVELKQATPKGGRLTIGGRPVAMFEQKEKALGWMVALLGQQQGFTQLKQEQWTLFRGNPSRNAISSPAAPIWDAHWKVSTFQEKRLVGSEQSRFEAAEKKMRAEGLKRAQGDNLLGISASHPLVVDEYVIYRSLRKIRATNLRTGKPLWETVTSSPAVEQIIRFNKVKKTANRRYSYYGQTTLPLDDALLTQRTWRDMTLGTLSSNGKYVFAVDDVGIVNAFSNYPGQQENPLGTKKYNKLRGFELTTGKFKWEIGGPRGDAQLEAAGTFFLGAPLPFGKLLYCIVEEDGEIQLVSIEPKPEEYDAKVVWRQPLASPQNTVKDDTVRRMSGLSPSYQDGVMVCPTSAGAVVAVDLSQRLLLWGYRYQTRAPQTPSPRGFGWGRSTNAGADQLDKQSHWLDSVPTIAEGKVLLTPRDSNQLHCLNLLDGTVQWTVEREQGLYLAGVHEGKVIVVGKTAINAYRLDNGKPAWQLSTPIPKPSGRGYQTGGLYHLPLSTGSIATVDLDTGRLLVKSKSRNGIIPGNLVAAQGTIISQSGTELSAYRSLSDLNNEVNKLLIVDGKDSSALSLRGELRLHHGQLEAGLKDLRKAIETKPNARAQTILAEAILDGLRSDFTKYQARSAELERLIVDPEQKTRYLRVYADGLWRSGDQLGAIKKYIEFSGPSTGKLQLQQIDGSTSVRSDRLLRSRLKMFSLNATPQEQLALTQLIQEQQIASQAAKDSKSLRKFIQCFSGTPVAEQAQRQLVKKLDNVKNGLELELLLQSLRKSSNLKTAGYATARLTELYIQHSQSSQITQLFDQLQNSYADVECLNGKTGKELATIWKADKKVFLLLADEQIYPANYKATLAKSVGVRRSNYTYPVRIKGDSNGLFANRSLVVDNSAMSLIASDELGRKIWTVQLRKKRGSSSNYIQLYSARLFGNLMLFYMGDQFFVIDLAATSSSKRLLWKGNLIESNGNQTGRLNLQQMFKGGVLQWTLRDQNRRLVGRVGPITSDTIIYQQGNKVYAADPLSGEILWKRSGFEYGCEIIGDKEKLLVIAPSNKTGILISATDGERLGTQTLPKGDRLHTNGMKVVVSERVGVNQVLKCYDLISPENKPLWVEMFSSNSKFRILNNNKIASLNSQGDFQIHSLKDGKLIIKDKIKENKNLYQFVVLTSPDRYLLMMSPQNRFVQNGVNIMVNNSTMEVLIGGDVYAYHRKTGKRDWVTTIEKTAINPLQPLGTPFVALSSRTYQRVQKKIGNKNRWTSKSSYNFSVLDTRTGKMLYHKNSTRSTYPYSLRVDPKTKKVEFVLRQDTITLLPGKSPVKAKKP